MKPINSLNNLSEHQYAKDSNPIDSNQEIKKRLLKKYKPSKSLFAIETFTTINNQQKAA